MKEGISVIVELLATIFLVAVCTLGGVVVGAGIVMLVVYMTRGL